MLTVLADPMFLALLPLLTVLVLASQLSLFWALRAVSSNDEEE